MSSNLLKSLLGSRTRLNLLRIFLINPEVEFYLRELESILNEDLTAIRREVAKLSDDGLLKKVERGNRLYYYIDQKHNFFQPLRDLFIQSERERGAFIQLLSDRKAINEGLEHIVVYGKNEDLLSSTDWHMLFVGNLSPERLEQFVPVMENKLSKTLFVKFYSNIDYQEMLESDDSRLDEVFAGSICEIKRKGIYL